MSKSRKSHIRKMYDLRFDFKYVLANVFFTNPEAFLSCFYNKNLDVLLKNIWSNYVKRENYNPEIYSTEFDVKYPSLDNSDEVFMVFNMPDILDVNKPKIEYSWHASVGVSYFLYYNLKNRNTKYYVCESSIKSTMDMAMMEGKYVPVYFVVELYASGRRNIGQIASHSIEEVRDSFHNAVLADLQRTVRVDNSKQLEHSENSEHSELWNAILNKSPYEEIKRLVEADADLDEEGNEEDDFYDIINVVFDHPDSYEITKLFVEHGYNTKKMLKNGINVITESIFCDDPRVFFYLYSIDQNVMLQNNDDNVNILHVAAISNNKPDIIKFLIDKGAPIDSVNENGWGIAHFAAQNPNPEILQMLLDYGVTVEYKDHKELKAFQSLDYSIINDPNNNKYLTPLALASICGSPEVCEILIKAGARLEAKDKYGRTPLMLSTRNKNPDVFRLLLRYGANINALDYMKEGVLNHALRYSPLEHVVEIAERTKAHFHDYNYKIYINNIEKMNKTRELARKDPDFLNMLLSAGIDPDLPKEKKLPYIFLAAENPDLRILDFLSEKGCDLSLGTYEENVASHALENNSNPSAIDYLISRKLLPNSNSFISEHIVKNPFPEVWHRVLELGFPYEYQDEQGTSLLMKVFKANQNPNPDIVALLSDEKTVNLKDALGLTACHYAAQKDNVIYLKILRMRGANLNEKENYQSTTPLMAACATNPNPVVIDYLVKNGADINERCLHGKDALLYSANNPNPKIALYLIKELNANIHTKNRDGKNLLMEAIKADSFKLVESLIKLGMDVNEKDNYGNPAIAFSVYYSPSIEILELLLKNGADINFKTDKNVNLFIIAARNNSNEKIIEYFLNKGFSIDYATSDGETPLLAAAQNSNWLVLDTLIKRGANLKDVDNNKQNVLITASMCNDEPYIIKYLIEKGVPINYCDKEENTAIICAAMNPNVNIIKTLVENGADLNSVNSIGGNALMIAASSQENLDVIKYLIENGLDVNATNIYGSTALMFAAGNNPNPEVVELLITAGADMSAEDNSGNNAYKIAKEHNPNPAVAEKIKKCMMSMSSYSTSSFYNPSSNDIN